MFAEVEFAAINLRPCCVDTVARFSNLNPMIMCPSCKHMIKSFKDIASFQMYLKFCDSQNRFVDAGRYGDLFVVLYQPFRVAHTNRQMRTMSPRTQAEASLLQSS